MTAKQIKHLQGMLSFLGILEIKQNECNVRDTSAGQLMGLSGH